MFHWAGNRHTLAIITTQILPMFPKKRARFRIRPGRSLEKKGNKEIMMVGKDKTRKKVNEMAKKVKMAAIVLRK